MYVLVCYEIGPVRTTCSTEATVSSCRDTPRVCWAHTAVEQKRSIPVGADAGDREHPPRVRAMREHFKIF